MELNIPRQTFKLAEKGAQKWDSFWWNQNGISSLRSECNINKKNTLDNEIMGWSHFQLKHGFSLFQEKLY